VAREYNPQMGDLARIEVYGVPEMLALLKTIDPALRKATQAKMKLAAAPILAEARSLIPEVAIEPGEKGRKRGGGWKVTGRLGYDAKAVRRSIKVTFKGSRIRDKNANTFPLLKLVLGSAGGSIFDMAGRSGSGNTPSGTALIRKLQKDRGGASRVMWRSVESKIGEVEQGVKDAIADMEYAINQRAQMGNK
jgi:hypothetical protein